MSRLFSGADHSNQCEACFNGCGLPELADDECVYCSLVEARAAFDAAMEYADSAYCDRCYEAGTFFETGHGDIEYTKPRPVAPWRKGE